MTVMSEPDASPVPGAPAPPDARGIVLGDLVARLATGVLERARRYEVVAGLANGLLRRTLEDLARARRLEAADLLPFARRLGAWAGPEGAVPAPAPPVSWGRVLGEAFQDERVLERIAREVALLAPDPPLQAQAARLAVGAARAAREIRKLYLRYS